MEDDDDEEMNMDMSDQDTRVSDELLQAATEARLPSDDDDDFWAPDCTQFNNSTFKLLRISDYNHVGIIIHYGAFYPEWTSFASYLMLFFFKPSDLQPHPFSFSPRNHWDFNIFYPDHIEALSFMMVLYTCFEHYILETLVFSASHWVHTHFVLFTKFLPTPVVSSISVTPGLNTFLVQLPELLVFWSFFSLFSFSDLYALFCPFSQLCREIQYIQQGSYI